MRKFVFIALAVLVIGGAGLYVYMGGLNSIDISVEPVNGYEIAGREFKGLADAQEIEDYFFEAKEYVESGELDGVLTIIHYNDTTLEKKETRLFIGVNLKSFDGQLPAGYVLKNIACQKAVRARIEANNAVIPGPETIEERLSEKAQSEGLTVTLFTIEKYISKNVIEIDWPVK